MSDDAPAPLPVVLVTEPAMHAAVSPPPHDEDDDDQGPQEYVFVNPRAQACVCERAPGDENFVCSCGAAAALEAEEAGVAAPTADYRPLDTQPVDDVEDVVPARSALHALPEDDAEHDHDESVDAAPTRGGEASVASAASASATAEAATADEDEEEDDTDPRLPMEAVESIVSQQLRVMERDYEQTSSSSGGSATTAAPALTVVDRMALAKLAQRGASEEELRARAAALMETRARMRALRTAGPALELADGADEFPDDYDALQAADHATVRATLSVVDDFDPFGASAAAGGAASASAAIAAEEAPAAAAPVHAAVVSPVATARAPSPLPSERVSTIKEIMGRIQLKPRGGVSSHTERVVQAALRHASALPRSSGLK